MQKYKIIIAYDGTDFCGWAMQPGKKTISGILQTAFYRTFDEKIVILGASRTDAGVHALHQVAQFSSSVRVSVDAMRDAWNDALPSGIHIRSIVLSDASFHPCRNVRQKTYYYTLFLKKPLPFVARYGWYYRFIKFVDLDKFYACLQKYVGEHDFASFCKLEKKEKSTIRRIDSIVVKSIPRHAALLISIKGKSFLHFQIRRMIGYALDIARRKDLTVEHLQVVMDSKNPQQSLLKADGKGLCLRKVIYHDQ